MPYSYAVYTGNGATTQFTVPFPYIRREHVVASLDYVSAVFTWVNNTTVEISPAPANGVRVEVRRITPVNAPLVDFTDGSTLVAADLDTNALQQTYINQEQDDQFQDGISTNPQGLLDAGAQRITNVANPTSAQDAATKAYVDTGDALKVAKAGDTMSGPLAMGTNKVTGVGEPTAAQDAATKNYVDTNDALKVAKAGDTMSGPLAMGSNKITGLGAPTAATDAATRAYVDGVVTTGVPDGDKGDIIVGGGGLSWTIDSGVVTNDKIASSAVTSDKIQNGTIVDADINASAGITGTKVEAGSTTVRGTLQLTDSTSSTSSTTAATPNSVKTAWDLADAALPKAGGTLSGNVENTATGYFDLPVGTTAQRPVSPNSGYVRFNTDLGQYEGYNGSAWASIGGGATGGGADRVFMENDQTITQNYTITAGRNAVTAGPVTINTGVTVTVPSGSSWVVV
jgi:hypothetical protein